MVQSACSITLLSVSFDFALPSEGKDSSWIDWTIEIFPSIRSVLLYLFPAHMSRFRVSNHTTYCARRSLTSYRPVVHTCSHFGVRVRLSHMPRGTAHTAAAGPSTFWLHMRQWASLCAACWSYYLHIVWHWLMNARIRAELLKKSIFSLFLLGCPNHKLHD